MDNCIPQVTFLFLDYGVGFYFVIILSCSPEEKVQLLEKQVTELIEESCFAAERNDLQMVLFTINIIHQRKSLFN